MTSNCCRLPAATLSVQKASNPLVDADFVRMIRRFSQEIQRSVTPIKVQPIRRILQGLDQRWATMNIVQRARVLKDLEEEIKRANSFSAIVVPGLLPVSRTVAQKTAKAMYLQEGVTPRQLDVEESVQEVADITGAFIERQEKKSTRAFLALLASLLVTVEEQRTSEEITQNLQQKVVNFFNSPAYWNQMAATHLTTLRSYHQAIVLQDIGRETYTWISVIDSVTTDICRFMDGKTFSVNTAVANFKKAHQKIVDFGISEFEAASPFIRRKRVDDTSFALIMNTPLGDRVIAEELTRGGETTYNQLIEDQVLEEYGVGLPPIHIMCRSRVQ